MFSSLFDKQPNNTLNKIIGLTSTILDSNTVNKLLASQKQHADAIYEVLTLLKNKGKQNHPQSWIDDTLYYSPNADVYTLLSSENIITSLENARLLDASILPALREKKSFSQQDFNTLVKQSIAKDNTENLEETISPLTAERDEEMSLLNKKSR